MNRSSLAPAMWSARAGCAVLLLMLAGPVGAADPPKGPVFTSEVVLRTPKKGGDQRSGNPNTAPFSLFVPDEVPLIRGLVFNPFYEKAVEQVHWRTAASHWGFAVAGANLFRVRAEERREVVLGGLKSLAECSGHPEIAHAPLCLIGMSIGGGLCVHLSEAIPERVIAAAPVCLEVGPTSEATRGIPMLTVFGERDGRQMEILTRKLPEQRTLGAQWGIAVQWGRKHEFGKANNLIMPFFDAVIRQRYPANLHPSNGPPELKPFPDEKAWFGDLEDWDREGLATIDFVGPKNRPSFEWGKACWFPDEDCAWAWRAFVAREHPIRITAPPGLGDGQALVIHAAGAPLKVTGKVSPGVSLRSLELYVGGRAVDKLEGDREEFAFEVRGLERGIHPLSVKGWLEDGTHRLSPLHTILAR